MESIKRLKNKLKYAKNSVKRMEENENINLIRLAEAEKNWLVFKNGEKEVTYNKNFLEELNAEQLFKEKFEKVQKEVILLLEFRCVNNLLTNLHFHMNRNAL